MDVPLLALTNQPSRLPGRSPQEAVIENMRLLIQLRWIAVRGRWSPSWSRTSARRDAAAGAMLSVAGLLALGNLLFT
jgi:hypothetical protein